MFRDRPVSWRLTFSPTIGGLDLAIVDGLGVAFAHRGDLEAALEARVFGLPGEERERGERSNI